MMKLRKIKSTVLIIFIILFVVFMVVHACNADFKNAFACGAIAILSIMLLVIYLFDDVVVIFNNKNLESSDKKDV